MLFPFLFPQVALPSTIEYYQQYKDRTRNRFFIYEVTCDTPNHVYVGKTHDLWSRLAAHLSGSGSVFVKQHGFKSARIVMLVERGDAREMEARWQHVLARRGFVVGGCTSTKRSVCHICRTRMVCGTTH